MQTILITGANRGIGFALARIYLARGERIIAAVRTPTAATALQALAGPDRLTLLPLDVRDEAGFVTAAALIGTQPLDLLVCNAGAMGARGGIDDPGNTAKDWNALFATNVTGVMLTVKTFLPNVQRAKGRIAVISSRMGSSTRASGSNYAYRASKAAVANFAANLASELKQSGVAVAAYHPGWVRTDMGGPGGDIDVDTSASGLVARFDSLSIATSGSFENYDGAPIPF